MITCNRGRARIGILVPFTNTNLEADLALLCPPALGVTLHYARLGDYDEDAIPDEEQMAGLGDADLSEPLRLLMGVRPDVVLYGCTSATLAHGPGFDNTLSRDIMDRWGVPAVTAAGALISALKALAVKKIAFASPYVAALNQRSIAFLQQSGFAIVSSSQLETELDNIGQGALSPEEIAMLARRADSREAQALVLSCTDMRALETIQLLETELGKPVISSNQALLYSALQYIDIEPQEIGWGSLFHRENIGDG